MGVAAWVHGTGLIAAALQAVMTRRSTAAAAAVKEAQAAAKQAQLGAVVKPDVLLTVAAVAMRCVLSVMFRATVMKPFAWVQPALGP